DAMGEVNLLVGLDDVPSQQLLPFKLFLENYAGNFVIKEVNHPYGVTLPGPSIGWLLNPSSLPIDDSWLDILGPDLVALYDTAAFIHQTGTLQVRLGTQDIAHDLYELDMDPGAGPAIVSMVTAKINQYIADSAQAALFLQNYES